MFNIILVAKSIFILAFLFLGINFSYADDIATAMCKNYVPAVWAIAKPMRDVGIPIATAEEHVYKMGIEDKDRKSTRLNSSHSQQSRMPSSA